MGFVFKRDFESLPWAAAADSSAGFQVLSIFFQKTIIFHKAKPLSGSPIVDAAHSRKMKMPWLGGWRRFAALLEDHKGNDKIRYILHSFTTGARRRPDTAR